MEEAVLVRIISIYDDEDDDDVKVLVERQQHSINKIFLKYNLILITVK